MTRSACVLLGALLALGAHAQTVPLQALGDLELAFTPVKSTDRVPGAPRRAQVRARAGNAYRTLLPRTAQRVVFMMPSGTPVQTGDPVVRVEGPEIHHWLLEYQAIANRYERARQRYEANRALFEDGALPAERWAAIEDRYFELGLAYEHMRHFHALIVKAMPTDDALLLGAPRPGLVAFDSRIDSYPLGAELFRIIPENALRLQLETPVTGRHRLSAIRVANCTLTVDTIEGTARNFFFTAWSEPLSGECRWAPGAVLSARPLYTRDALVVPRSAVFQWQQAPHVLLRDGEQLRATPVDPLADTDGGYVIADSEALAGGEVLSASVSAVQGILLGLGKN